MQCREKPEHTLQVYICCQTQRKPIERHHLMTEWLHIMECQEAREWFTSLDVGETKGKPIKSVYMQVMKQKRRIWEVSRQSLETQEKARACGKFLGVVSAW